MIKLKYKIIIPLLLILLSVYLPIESYATSISVKVAVNCNLPPFQYLDKNGNIVGLYIDILNEIAKNEDLIIEYIVFNETSKAIEALKNGLVDVVLGVSSRNDVSSELKKTNDIYSATLCMLVGNENIAKVLNNEQDQRTYSSAFELDTISFSQLSQLKNSGNNLVVGDQIQLYNTLIKKQSESVIGVKESMVYMLESNAVEDSYAIVHNYISSIDYSLMLRKNDLVLYNSINRGINRLRTSNTYEQLLDKWIGNTEQEIAQGMKKKMLSYIAIFVAIALIVISIIGYMNYKLKEIVADKTKEISKKMQQIEDESILRERLIEFSPAGIILLKKDGSVLMMNSIIRMMEGIDEKSIQSGLNIRDLNVMGELYRQVSCNGTTTAGGPATIKYDSKDCNNQIFRCQCQSVNSENYSVMMVEDITKEEEEKQVIFELRKSKALNQIIAGMAHEIKNPLMSINTFASLIQKQGKEEEFQALFSKHVPKEVERINKLINMLINYTRPTRNKKERVSISELINDSIYLVQISAKDTAQIDFKANIKLQAYIFVDKDQIKQALINLIMNSIQSVEEKLNEKEGNFSDLLAVSVTSYRRNEKICIEVYDEGCGMNESDIERCVDPFFTTKATGLGMGLALTKQYVNDNAGKLEIESCKNEFTIIRMLFEEDA